MLLPDNRELMLGAAGVALVAIALYLLAQHGKEAGAAIGRGVGNFTGAAASGVIYGLGDAAGLPDTSDIQVQASGRAALEDGRYLEASTKLPALEFLNGLGSQLGIWAYNVTHADEARDLSAGAHVRTAPPDPALLTDRSPFFGGA